MLRKLMWRYTIILSKCVYKVRCTAIATFFRNSMQRNLTCSSNRLAIDILEASNILLKQVFSSCNFFFD